MSQRQGMSRPACYQSPAKLAQHAVHVMKLWYDVMPYVAASEQNALIMLE